MEFTGYTFSAGCIIIFPTAVSGADMIRRSVSNGKERKQ